MIELFRRLWKDAELHRSTIDVDDDIKHLLIMKRVKFWMFWGATIVIAAVSYYKGMSYIKSDPFRANLIEYAKIAPAFTFAYEDYADEKKKIGSERKELQSRLEKMKERLMVLRDGVRDRSVYYSEDKFLKDAARGDVNLSKPIEHYIRQTDAFKRYARTYLYNRIAQDQNHTIVLNGKVYTYKQITQKLKPLARAERKERIEAPAKAMAAKYGLAPSKAVVDTIDDMIRENVAYINDRQRAKLTANKIGGEDEFLSAYKNMILGGNSSFALDAGNGKEYRYRRGSIGYMMRSEYKLAVKALREEAKRKQVLAKQKLQKEKAKAEKLIEKINKLVDELNLIDAIQRVGSKEKLEKNIEKLEKILKGGA